MLARQPPARLWRARAGRSERGPDIFLAGRPAGNMLAAGIRVVADVGHIVRLTSLSRTMAPSAGSLAAIADLFTDPVYRGPVTFKPLPEVPGGCRIGLVNGQLSVTLRHRQGARGSASDHHRSIREPACVSGPGLRFGWRQELFAQGVAEPVLVPGEAPLPGVHEPPEDVAGGEDPRDVDGGGAVQAGLERALAEEGVDDDRRAAAPFVLASAPQVAQVLT
jgi:hypothetical protein